MESYRESDFYKNASPEDRAKWDEAEAMLAKEGLSDSLKSTAEELGKAGVGRIVSFEEEKRAVREMQNMIDDEVEEENKREIDIQEFHKGEPPCRRLKRFQEDTYGAKPDTTNH